MPLNGENLTRDLLSLHGNRRDFETISVTAQVEQLIDMIQRTHRGQIAIRSDLFDEALYVNGDASLLFQAMLNICLNGIDAMDGSGELRIRLFLQAKQNLHRNEDHGCGMTEADKNRIFEPFLPRNRSDKAPGWAWQWPMVSLRNMVDTFASRLG